VSAEAAFVRSWAVGAFTATLSCPPLRRGGGPALAAVIEWSPHVPQKLSPEETEQYQRGRDQALRDLIAEGAGAAPVHPAPSHGRSSP
jgi:hypothetical protein